MESLREMADRARLSAYGYNSESPLVLAMAYRDFGPTMQMQQIDMHSPGPSDIHGASWDQHTYRVSLLCDLYEYARNKGAFACVTALEIGDFLGLNGMYMTEAELPQQMREKLALLSIVPLDKPTRWIRNIGQRIDEHTYWIYMENDYGDDAGS